MVGAIDTFHKHVVDIYLHYVSNQLLEDFIDHPLKSGSGVLQAKGHDFETVDDAANGEGCLVVIFWMHLDLLVSRLSIHEAEKFDVRCRVNHLVYAG